MKQLTARFGSPENTLARRWWALAMLCLSLIVVTIDTTILNVALPTLVRDLHPSSSQLEWIVDAYTVVFAGLLLTMGGLGDRFGRRGALSIGLGIFALACAFSAISTSPTELIITRAMTGAGAALVFPATLSILINVFQDQTERQKAIAIWSGTAGIGIGLGPVAGGLLLRHFSWGSIFWVNVPICVVALIGGLFAMPTSRDPEEAPIDIPGAALSIVGLSSLVYGIIQGPSNGWSSTTVLGAFALAVVALLGFALVELRNPRPMLDFRLFQNPRFTAASLAVTALYFCLFGTIFYQTEQMQFVMGYDPLGAGLRSVPFAVVLLLVANNTPRMVRRVGTRAMITAGLLVVAASMALRATYSPGTGYGLVLVGQLIFAAGMGLTIAPATASIMGAVPPNRAGVGSAINDTTRQVGGSIGVALMGSIGASLYHHSMTKSIATLHLPAAVTSRARDSIGSALEAVKQLSAADGAALSRASRAAFMHGLDIASAVAVLVALAGALTAARYLPGKQPTIAASGGEFVDCGADLTDAEALIATEVDA